MDCAQDERTEQCGRIESVIAGGAIGGLIGMLLGPLATLVCAAVGAEVGRRLSTE
jgi:predicted PurR-regulated permease PerM